MTPLFEGAARIRKLLLRYLPYQPQEAPSSKRMRGLPLKSLTGSVNNFQPIKLFRDVVYGVEMVVGWWSTILSGILFKVCVICASLLDDSRSLRQHILKLEAYTLSPCEQMQQPPTNEGKR